MKTQLLKICDSFNLYPLFNVFTRNRAAVFMMHRFCDQHEYDGDSITAEVLDARLKYLSDKGYAVIPLSEYVRKLMDGSRLYKTVVFTVDDGYRNFYDYAYPVFKKYDMPAAVFLTTDFIDGKTRLWWDQVRDAVNGKEEGDIEIDLGGRSFRYPVSSDQEKEHAARQIIDFCKMLPDDRRRAVVSRLGEKTKGRSGDLNEQMGPLSWKQVLEMQNHHIEFFPHTRTHPVLIQCDPETTRREISDSKKRVQLQTRRPADIFCYPNGKFSDFDDAVIALLKEEGYAAAFTAEEGFDHSRKVNDMFRLRRYPFPTDILRFKQLVSGLEGFKNALRNMHE